MKNIKVRVVVEVSMDEMAEEYMFPLSFPTQKVGIDELDTILNKHVGEGDQGISFTVLDIQEQVYETINYEDEEE